MITEKNVSFKSEEDGRVDKVASAIVPRSIFSQADTIIKVNGKAVKKSQKIKQNDFVEILYKEETFEGLEAEDISLNVIYEDDAILVINKDCGMVVHPGAGNHSGTVVNALLNKFGDDFVYTSNVPNFFNKASEQGYSAEEINKAYENWKSDKEKYKKELLRLMKTGKKLSSNEVKRIMRKSGIKKKRRK